MAISRKSQEAALAKLGYTPDQIKAHLDDAKEVDIDIPDVTVYTPASLAELETNLRKGYIKEDAASEIWCRKMNKDHELGLKGDDARNPDKVSEALKAKWGVVVDETEQARRFKELQDEFGKKDTEILTAKQQLEAMQNERLYRKMFFKDMSDALDEDEWIARLQKNFEIKKEGDITGLVDRATGKFITDKAKNVLPYQTAWEQLRTAEPDRFKSWVKAPEPVTPEPKQTHDPRRGKNPINTGKVARYKTLDEINAEVEKKYPMKDKGSVRNWARDRQAYFNQLRAETV